MKRKFKTIIGASAASVLAFTVSAQQSINPVTDQAVSTRQDSPKTCATRLNGTAKTSDVIGTTVKNYQQEKLGKVKDLVLDVESGRIVQVILASGGFLGMGDTLTAVPPDALHHEAGQKFLQLDASLEKFKAAPKFDASNWSEDRQSNDVSVVYGYYGEQPYFAANPDGSWNTNTDGTINSYGAHAINKVNYAESSVAETNEVSTTMPDGTRSRNYNSREYRTGSAHSSLGYCQKAGKLIGATVWNPQGEKLGKVENFVVDLAAGRIVAVIISSGGFMGMDGELSAIPPTALRFNGERDALQLDASQAVLASSPHFKANEWPDFNQPEYTTGIYRAYAVEPYFNTGTATAADNTRQNLRDRGSRTLTPLDQGNSQADVDITAQIRRAIMADQGMSVNAKNVKIITIDGRVTLRGPVNTAAEKSRIGVIADRIAQPGNVDNELDVQLVTSN